VKMFDADKTGMIGLPYSEKATTIYYDTFSSDTGTSRTDRQMDRQNCYINITHQCADVR